MDEETIKQMMQEYNQAIDKAVFLAGLIREGVIQLGRDVESEDMIAKLLPETDVFRADVLLDRK